MPPLPFFLPRPGPALILRLGGGGRRRGVAAAWVREGAGAWTVSTRVEMISPLTAWPSARVTSSVYGLPAASTRLTVALVTVAPGAFSSTVLLAIVMVFLRRLARCERVGASTFLGICFQILMEKPLGSDSSSFFSGFSLAAASAASSSSSVGVGRL